MTLRSVPPEIIAAALEVQREVGKLGKDDFNAHGKYHFVSIDTYYQHVASVAANPGLTWVSQVTGTTFTAGDKPNIRFDYSFDLLHSSGAVAHGLFRHPVVHPVQGAQTAGSALSYADKLFMRHLFKVVTGEGDADSTAPDAFDLTPRMMPAPVAAAPQPKPTAPLPAYNPMLDEDGLAQAIHKVAAGLRDNKPVLHVPDVHSDFDLVERVLTVFVELCRDKEELIGFWEQNIAALDAMLTLAPEAHQRVKSAFVARKAQVPETANGR
jgi:hypothetical protein